MPNLYPGRSTVARFFCALLLLTSAPAAYTFSHPTALSALAERVRPAAAPTITGFSPASGPSGSTILITGTDFTGTTDVLFGGAPASSFVVNPAGTGITATVPAGAGPVFIEVITPEGMAMSPAAFEILNGTPSINAVYSGDPIDAGCYTEFYQPNGAFTFTINDDSPIGDLQVSASFQADQSPGQPWSVAGTMTGNELTITTADLRNVNFTNGYSGILMVEVTDPFGETAIYTSGPLGLGINLMVDAGSDQQVTSGDPVLVQASVSSYDPSHVALEWMTSGTGTFTQVDALATEYVPSAADLAAGSVSLIMTATQSPNSTRFLCAGTDEVVISFASQPAITGFSPTSGVGGSTVTITGSGFNGATAVLFGGTASPGFTVNQGGTQITATVPAGSGLVTIQVVTPSGSATSTTGFTIFNTAPSISDSYQGDPIEAGCYPQFYQPSGAFTFTITDDSHIGELQIAAAFHSDQNPGQPTAVAGTLTGNELVITAADLATAGLTNGYSGTLIVEVTDPFGEVASFSTNPLGLGIQLTVTAGPDQQVAPGDPIQLQGTVDPFTAQDVTLTWLTSGTGSFTQPGELTTGYVPSADDLAAGSVTLTFTAAQAPVSGRFLCAGTDDVVITFDSAPVISSFTPACGEAGTVVAITGTGFTGATTVAFNGIAAASFSVVSDTRIDAAVPAGAVEGLITVVANGQTASSQSAFGLLPMAVITVGGPTTLCQGDSVVLTASGGSSYQWSTGATTPSITVTSSGSYSVTVTSTAGCSATSAATSVSVNPQASAAFAYSSTTFCLSSANPVPTISGDAGGTFAATPAGLVLDPVTGQVDLSASTAGTYSVSYSVGGACPASQSQVLTLTTAPSAAFSYPASGPYCAGSGGTLAPVLAPGAGAGTFSASSPDLSLDAATGAINLMNSLPGFYVVTNAVAASGSCPAVSDSVTVTLGETPAVGLAADPDSVFCAGDSVLLVAGQGVGQQRVGPQGVSQTYQFFLNGQPVTGATADNQYWATQPGSYTVTLTTSFGCTDTSAPVTLTLSGPQSAAFSYGAATYCLGGQSPVPTVTGVTGGTFSSTPALPLDSATGEIDLTVATAGTYQVVYTTPGPCTESDTVTLTLTTAPLATFEYPSGSSLCAGTTSTLTPVLAPGAVAGTFSASSPDLSLDPVTGAINLGASLPGAYVVTNTVAPSGSCPAAVDSIGIVLGEAPSVTLLADPDTSFCSGDSIQLIAMVGNERRANGPQGGSHTYQFFLNGQPVAGPGPDEHYWATQPGTYTVTVTTSFGCVASSAAVTLTPPVTQSAAFSYGTSIFCLGGQNPVPVITGATGGSFSSTSPLPLDPATGEIDLAVAAAGTYQVVYTTPGPCTGSDTLTLTLTTAPSAVFTYPTGGHCAGSSASLMPAFGAGAAAGTFSAVPAGLTLNPTTGVIDLATSAAGTYTISNILAASGACAADTATATVTIELLPTAVITVGGPTTLCQGDSVVLTASGGSSYQWSTGATTPSITVTSSGSYSVTVTSSAGCSATSAATNVSVNPQASAAFAYSSTTFCLSSANPVPTISGDAGGTFAATPAGLVLDPATGQVDLSASTAGTYSVSYSVGGACPASQSQVLTLTTAPSAAFSYPASGPYCAGSGGTLAPVLAPGAGAGTFSALPAGLVIDPSTGVIGLTGSAAGTYTVSNVVAGGNGCAADTSTATIVVEAVPVATILAVGSTTFCDGDSVVLTAMGGGTFLWSNGATTTSIVVRQGGAYTVTVTNAAGCQATSAATTVTVNPVPPQPSFTAMTQAGGSVLLTSNSATGNQWYLNGNPISGASGQTYQVTSAAQNGVYTVVVSNGTCTSVPSLAQNITITGTARDVTALPVQVYPNPTTDGVVVLQLPDGLGATSLMVLDATGRTITRFNLPVGETHPRVDLHELPTGVYTLRLVAPEGIAVRRLVRE